MDRRSLHKLLTPQGWTLLASLPPYDPDGALQLATGLRSRGIDADLVSAVMTQSRLRTKATAKFGEFASEMLFTPDGLEQATRLVVAVRHARRFADAGAGLVADLGCGIGGDAMAIAGLETAVLAIERDDLTAAIAAVNLRQFEGARVIKADALTADIGAADAIFADPARRTRSGARVFNPKAYSPDLDSLLALRHEIPTLGIKVGPGIPYTALPSDAHAQWVSVDGDVVEAGLWFGAAAPEGSGRSALVIEGGRSHLLSTSGDADAPVPQAETAPLRSFLYEPDGAVIRAGLIAPLAAQIDATLVDPSIAYLSTTAKNSTPFARGYRVLDSFDFSLKRLRAYLRERNVGTITIKKRGTAVVPDHLRQQLALSGSREATIVLTRLAGKQSVIVVDPL